MTGTRRNVLQLSKKNILTLLRKEIKSAGGQSEWCRQKRINRPQLNKVLNGRKPISPRILKALNITTIYVLDADSGSSTS